MVTSKRGIKLRSACFRCKFHCHDINKEVGEVRFAPVYSGSEENEQYFKATPGGSFTLSGLKPETVDRFHIGSEYYIDIFPMIVPNKE